PGLHLPPRIASLRLPRDRPRENPHPPADLSLRRGGGAEPPVPERTSSGLENGGMSGRLAGTTLVALAVALVLSALSLVAWRQSRALEALATLDGVRRERSLQEAEKEELLRQIRHLESRGRVVRDAEERLGLRVPDDSEMVF